MTLWLLMTMICSAVAVFVSVPLIRRFDASPDTAAQDKAVYEDQIKEVQSDLSSGAIDPREAGAAKAEIEKRLAKVAQESSAARPISPAWRLVALAATAGLVILGGVNLYAWMGNPEMPSVSPTQSPAPAQQQVQADTSAAAQGNAAPTQGQVDALIAKLQARLKASPNDAEGWRMLGWAMFNTQRYQESADAYAKAVEIDPGNIDYKSGYAESLVQAAQGVVIPKAQELIAQVLAKSPKDDRARFYDALAHEQSGDQAGALDRWMALLADAPPDAGWRDDVKQRIAELGKATGRDVSASLSGAAPGVPQASAPPNKDAMVAGMIAGLAAKLQANPKDRDGWAMMIRSLVVTGDQKGADEALAKALDIFKDDPSTVEGLKGVMQAAQSAKAGGAQQGSAVPPASSAPKISADQQAAVEAMPQGDQQAMIKSMVERLAGKMKDNPHDMDGWIRLMRAYQVLKDDGKAKQALSDALTAFAAEPDAQAKIKAAASELGIN